MNKKQFNIEDYRADLNQSPATDNDQLKQNPMMGGMDRDIDRLKSELVSGYRNAQDSCGPESGDYNPIAETKFLRQSLDVQLQGLKGSLRRSRERSIAITKIQEAIMWLGMDLKDLGTANPYPQSYNPDSPVIEPTADNLKL